MNKIKNREIKKEFYLNPDLFFLIKEKSIYVWNYKKHEQYDLKEEYFNALHDVEQGKHTHIQNGVLQDLLESDLIRDKPYETIEWGWDDLSKIYHLGVSDVEGDVPENREDWLKSYITFSESVISKEEQNKENINPSGQIFDLPEPNLELLRKTTLWDSFKNRETTRQFNGQPISLENLSTILYLGFGKIHGEKWTKIEEASLGTYGYRRAHPSGGALQPVEGYIFVFNIEGLDSGVYFYDSEKHNLIQINNEVPKQDVVEKFMCGQYYSEGLSFGIVLTAHFKKVWGKYAHSRAYRDVYLDAGHLSQTILLTATSLDIRTWISAWYKDKSLSSALMLPDISYVPILFMGFGHGEKTPIPKGFDE